MTQTLSQKILYRVMAPSSWGRLTFVYEDGRRDIFGKDPEKLDAVIRVNNLAMFRKVVLYGDVGFGESYTDGDWSSPKVEDVISWFIQNKEYWPAISGTARKFSFVNFMGFFNRLYHAARPNNVTGSRRNIRDHYDLSNDFFRTFLDRTMTYSCAYFENPGQDLESAQIAKYDRLCRKLHLQPSDHVLEIGSGWGGFSIHAAKNYGCRVTTLTISAEQHRYAQERIRAEGLEDRIQILLKDYRHIEGQFDKIVSIEMLEAVGDQYMDLYFAKCQELLKKDGLMGIQVITCPDSRFASFKKNVDWIQKHIFPGSLLPSIGRIQRSLNHAGELMLHDLEDMGSFYAKTLHLWRDAFHQNLHRARALGKDQRFINKWHYYFSYCKAAFQTGNISVVQAVFTRPNRRFYSTF